MISAAPLSLIDCLTAGLRFSNLIQASRADVRAVGGAELIVNSRFFPRLSYDLSASAVENIGRSAGQGFLAAFELLEFGKDNPLDVALRQLQRQVLFRHEDVVARVLTEIRVRFFTILLKQEQLAERKKLRDEFATSYRRIVRLEKSRRVLEIDMLTARLNVLNEESCINALEKEIDRLKMDLLQLVGLPVEMTHFELAGKSELFDVDLSESVDIAIGRSTRIAQARADVWEQDRTVRQIIWEYLPNIRMQGGYSGSFTTVGMDIASDDSVYAATPFGERLIDSVNDPDFPRDPLTLVPDQSGWYGAVDLELPIFTGLERTGRFQQESAILEKIRHLLNESISQTTLRVSKAYETVEQEARETEILAERVQISKQRLQINERLKELGEISADQLETFRREFFADQDRYFEQQIALVEAQERLRAQMRYFGPVVKKEADEGQQK